jgi:hypothetical protein
MTANGQAAQMALFRFDFVDGQPQLNLRGHDQLVRISALLQAHDDWPLVIERTAMCPALAEARRLTVLNILAHAGCPVSPERVVIGLPVPNGLSGPEAELIYLNALSQVRSEGSRALLPQEPTAGGQSGQGAGGFTGGSGGAFGGAAAGGGFMGGTGAGTGSGY